MSNESSLVRWKPAIRITILMLICSVSTIVRIFSAIRYESIIHEFDPWFNYRATKFLVNHDFREFWNFFDSESWYPLGRNVGATVYPGLMVFHLSKFSPRQDSCISCSIRLASQPIFETFVWCSLQSLPPSARLPLICSPAKSLRNMVPGWSQPCWWVWSPVICLDLWQAHMITRVWLFSLLSSHSMSSLRLVIQAASFGL